MPEYSEQDNGDFTFPTPLTPPPQMLSAATVRGYGHSSRGRVSPSSPLLSVPIRRSFSAADCAGSPWRSSPRAGCSPALSDYAARYFDQLGDEDEEVMDSLWEDLNDDYEEEEVVVQGKKGVVAHLFRSSLDVSRRRSVGAAEAVQTRKQPTLAAKKDQGEVLAASRSSRRRPAGLVVMMRALKRMLVAHKSRSKVHKVDEQSTGAAAAPAPPVSSSSRGRK